MLHAILILFTVSSCHDPLQPPNTSTIYSCKSEGLFKACIHVFHTYFIIINLYITTLFPLILVVGRKQGWCCSYVLLVNLTNRSFVYWGTMQKVPTRSFSPQIPNIWSFQTLRWREPHDRANLKYYMYPIPIVFISTWILTYIGWGNTCNSSYILQDIASKILAFAQQRPRALCILSANGAVSAVTLRQPTSSSTTVTYEVEAF